MSKEIQRAEAAAMRSSERLRKARLADARIRLGALMRTDARLRGKVEAIQTELSALAQEISAVEQEIAGLEVVA